MTARFDYTSRARRIAYRHPYFTAIAIQINFWLAAYLLLGLVMYLTSVAVGSSHGIEMDNSFLPPLVWAIFTGVCYGAVLGGLDIFLEQKFLRGKPMGLIVLLRGAIYFLVQIVIFAIVRYVIWDYIFVVHIYDGVAPPINNEAWTYYFYIILIYSLAATFVISFIVQMNKKFGPGVLLPLLLGRYRNPKEEQRIFMFMDLKASTTLAEKLGHVRYSAFIRDAFSDINHVLPRYQVEVYQYVGDEIVLSWPMSVDAGPLTSIDFFFACRDQFNRRRDYYTRHYGVIPSFKAGLHQGPVTVVEIGEVKTDIAYHGDTVNTTARIQSVCNDFDEVLLFSGQIKTYVDSDKHYKAESIGHVKLKGKDQPIAIFSTRQ